MSDKAPDKKKDDAPHGEEKKDAKKDAKKGGIAAMFTKLPVLITSVMVIQGAVLFTGFKMLSGGPSTASAEVSLEHGDETTDEAHGDAKTDEASGDAKADAHGDAKAGEGGGGAKTINPKKPTEVLVVEFRAPNKRSGRTFLYDVSIYAVVKGANKVKVEDAIKDRGALIKDRIRTIIAQADPEKLGAAEPGLETLRRQVKFQLDEIIGEGMVDEVLVPRCIPFRTDF